MSKPRRELAGPTGGGQRLAIEAHLAGRLFVRFPVDISFGEGSVLPADEVTDPGWLANYGLPPIRYRVICREQQFAEKLHAYTLYRSKGSNSRAKDLVDMLLLIEAELMDVGRVDQAVKRIFSLRKTHRFSGVIPSAPTAWKEIYPRLAADRGITLNCQEAVEILRRFLSFATAQ